MFVYLEWHNFLFLSVFCWAPCNYKFKTYDHNTSISFAILLELVTMSKTSLLSSDNPFLLLCFVFSSTVLIFHYLFIKCRGVVGPLAFRSPYAEQGSPPPPFLKNLERIVFKKNNFWLTFSQSWWLNKHTRTLKTSRHTPNKQKQDMEHNISLKNGNPLNHILMILKWTKD